MYSDVSEGGAIGLTFDVLSWIVLAVQDRSFPGHVEVGLYCHCWLRSAEILDGWMCDGSKWLLGDLERCSCEECFCERKGKGGVGHGGANRAKTPGNAKNTRRIF